MKHGKVVLAAIDDDPDLLALVSLAFGSDLELLTFADPMDGLEAIRRRRPHIVLVDLVMPGVSGMDVLERVVQIDPATDVILMTAHYTTESAVESIKKGACDYLNKPFTSEQLRQRVAPLIAAAKRRQRAQQLDEEMLEACSLKALSAATR